MYCKLPNFKLAPVGTRIPNGGGLLFALPELSHARVHHQFGTNLAAQRKEKYSTSIYVQHTGSGFMYTLYMSCGEWRVGSVGNKHSSLSTYVEIATQFGVELQAEAMSCQLGHGCDDSC